jgi:predicted RND superfamily exporter protein
MKVKDFFEWADKEFKAEMELMRVKGEEYTVSNEDKLKNFKSIADRLETTPSEVAMVYLLKHMDSIRNYVLNGVEASDESISGRIRDARNYLMLLHAIILESKGLDEREAEEKLPWFGVTSSSSPLKFTMVDEITMSEASEIECN